MRELYNEKLRAFKKEIEEKPKDGKPSRAHELVWLILWKWLILPKAITDSTGFPKILQHNSFPKLKKIILNFRWIHKYTQDRQNNPEQ